MVESYKTLYAQAVDRDGPNFKVQLNRIGNTAQTFLPNADTPYSFAWLDLRAQPVVCDVTRGGA